MVSRETFEAVRGSFGHWASWAIWAPAGPKPKDGISDLSFFDNPTPALLEALRPNYVLAGLNISRRPIQGNLGNFHDSNPAGQDYKLRHALVGTPLWGAYLTDVIKDFQERAAGKAMAYIRANPDFERENIATLRSELATLGVTSPVLVGLGNDAYKLLVRNFGKAYEVRRAPHYAMYIGLDDYRARFHEDVSLSTMATHGPGPAKDPV